MKSITKSPPPADYQLWYNTQKVLKVTFNYGSFLNPERRNLKEFMVVDQGFLCAYSMKRISKIDSHIEHIIPQTLCSFGQDVDYLNLLACYPKPNTGMCKYGAHPKKCWWIPTLFISPLNLSCELKFIFNIKGEIYPCGNSVPASTATINVLKLDEPSLVFERKKSIEEFLFGPDGASPLSCVDAKKAIDIIYKPNTSGILYEYCIAIHDALYEYLEMLKKVVPNPSLCS